MNRGQTVVSHREVVSESITNSVDFSIEGTFAVQPAIDVYSHGSPLGSWLPQIAKEYDGYEFTQLKVHYVTTCSSLTNGLMIMSYDPNPEGNVPSTFTAARNNAKCVTGPVRQNLTLDLTSSVVGRKLLTRTGVVGSYPLYDAGRFFIATTAGADTARIGYIEIEYELVLRNPQSEIGTDNGLNGLTNPIYPTETFALTVGSGYHYFGLTNTYRNCCQMQYLTTNAPGGKYGTPLVLPQAAVNRTAPLSFTPVLSNVTYSINNGNPVWAMKFIRTGRWNVKAILPGNWQNFALFGCEMLRWPKTVNLASGNPTWTSDVGVSISGGLTGVPSQFGVTRGFKTVEVGGTEDDDLALCLDTNFVVPDLDDQFTLAVGVRPVVGVGENDTGSYVVTLAQGGLRVQYTYLGPLDSFPVLTSLA